MVNIFYNDVSIDSNYGSSFVSMIYKVKLISHITVKLITLPVDSVIVERGADLVLDASKSYFSDRPYDAKNFDYEWICPKFLQSFCEGPATRSSITITWEQFTRK